MVVDIDELLYIRENTIQDLIDKMIKKLLEDGSDTLIAAIKESRGIWLSEGDNNIALVPFMCNNFIFARL